jgi:hypothetical protein
VEASFTCVCVGGCADAPSVSWDLGRSVEKLQGRRPRAAACRPATRPGARRATCALWASAVGKARRAGPPSLRIAAAERCVPAARPSVTHSHSPIRAFLFRCPFQADHLMWAKAPWISVASHHRTFGRAVSVRRLLLLPMSVVCLKCFGALNT